MATYIILNIIFLVGAIVIFRIRFKDVTRKTIGIYIVLFILTLIFDSILIRFGLVRYDTKKILGVYVGLAPIEDFFYPLLAVFIIPILWHRFKKDVVQ